MTDQTKPSVRVEQALLEDCLDFLRFDRNVFAEDLHKRLVAAIPYTQANEPAAQQVVIESATALSDNVQAGQAGPAVAAAPEPEGATTPTVAELLFNVVQLEAEVERLAKENAAMMEDIPRLLESLSGEVKRRLEISRELAALQKVMEDSVSVPRVPTSAMLIAGFTEMHAPYSDETGEQRTARIYKAMLLAATPRRKG